jgi:hypothetical protein
MVLSAFLFTITPVGLELSQIPRVPFSCCCLWDFSVGKMSDTGHATERYRSNIGHHIDGHTTAISRNTPKILVDTPIRLRLSTKLLLIIYGSLYILVVTI